MTLPVLIVEDSADDADLMSAELRQAGIEVLAERVENAEEMRAALAKQPWDLILSDFRLPRFNARQALELLQKTGVDIPFIAVSGAIGEVTAVELMRAGAHDYVMKDNLTRLPAAVTREIKEAQDRREHRRAAEALRESEERWQFALEGAGEGVWDWDVASGRVLFSARWKEMLGYAENEIGNGFEEWEKRLHPDDKARVLADLQAYFEGKTRTYVNDHRLLCKDGKWKWVLDRGMIVSRSPDGRPLRMIGTHADISARKQAEESLQLAAMVYQHSSEAMAIADAENIIVSINPAFTQTTGYVADEVIGQDPSILKSGRHDPAFYEAMWQSIKTTGHWQGEIWNRHKNGAAYAAYLTINTIFDADGLVSRRVALFSDITQKKESEELIWRHANFDALTQLPNRRMLLDRLNQAIKKSHRTGMSLALLFLDLDEFKDVNDTLGHDMGDILLKEAAQRMCSCVRGTDTVARLGGDEFTIVLGELEDTGSVERVAQEILQKLAAPFQLGTEVAYISASIGITLYPTDATEIEDLFKNADQAMYATKALGRNRYSYFTASMQEAAQSRKRLTSDLRSALLEQQFQIHYQPIVELQTGAIHKAEALIRWQHPTQGMISPTAFIPVAEETGMITGIGDWVFKEAAKQARLWRASHDADFQISINVSPVQFKDENYSPADWFEHLKQLGLSGQCVVIELTEGLLMEVNPAVNAKLLALRDAGMQVAIDDFGTGYSSLSYIKTFDIDYLKIDQSFVRNLSPNSDDLALCEAIIVMAHKLWLKVIAEGVETELQRELLQSAGCDYAQGYLFSKPVPAEEFVALLELRADAI
jgi:diguanylate cyclase (GGDEF)-like protein/PAS domain S-box-containing protein